MAILNTLIASSAVALSILAQAATPVNALAAPAHAHAVRHAGVSPNHNGMLKRKRNSHKNRKRCIAQQAPISASVDVSTPAYTPPAAPTDNGSNNNNNNGNNGNTYTPPANNGAPACSGGKVGLAWAPDLASNYIPNATTGRTCYYYNWSSWPADSSLTGNLKFVPMFWGGDHVQDFQDNVINSGNNYGVALAMNEVNQVGQANIDPGTGAYYWRTYLLPLRYNKGYYLVSPSTTSAPDGIPWMQNWLGQLGDNERPDALALHWYGYSYDDLVSYVNQFAATFPGYKLWITEFACTDFTGQGHWCNVPDFAGRARTFLDNHGAVEAYFPFGFVGSMMGVQEENRLMNGDGSVTQVGWEYIGN